MVAELNILLRSMARPRAFYILGAGTSAGLVPFTPELRVSVKKAFWQLGLYPVTRAQRTHLFERVVGGYRGGSSGDPSEVTLQHIPPGALELLVQRGLSFPLHSPIPAQYWLLQRVAAPGIFFSFNLDGLAMAHLRARHIVYEPHGSVDREWTTAINFTDFLEDSLDDTLPSIRPKLLPGPESSTMTDGLHYQRARCWLRRAPAVVVLGYSFGRSARGFDDSESFEYVIEHLKATKSIVFVVSPDPVELAGVIEERLHARRVVPVSLYWNKLCQAAMSVMQPWHQLADWICDDQLQVLQRAYAHQLS